MNLIKGQRWIYDNSHIVEPTITVLDNFNFITLPCLSLSDKKIRTWGFKSSDSNWKLLRNQDAPNA